MTSLWHAGLGVFVNRFSRANDTFYPRISPTSFYPMFANAATEEQVESMISNWLFNPSRWVWWWWACVAMGKASGGEGQRRGSTPRGARLQVLHFSARRFRRQHARLLLGSAFHQCGGPGLPAAGLLARVLVATGWLLVSTGAWAGAEPGAPPFVLLPAATCGAPWRS
jgi:hypothetical protein